MDDCVTAEVPAVGDVGAMSEEWTAWKPHERRNESRRENRAEDGTEHGVKTARKTERSAWWGCRARKMAKLTNA